jgi:DNA-binding transcriptional MerR regulator
MSVYNQDPDPLLARAYTSREAAQASGVPFFTVDYWDRTRFLVPTVSPGKGRGKGRQRLYSYGDLVRLRIARELREQRVSLETLRAIVRKLAQATDRLAGAKWVLVGSQVETARTPAELAALLGRSGRKSFGVVLDLRGSLAMVRKRARALARSR